jgi:hypothetical protein
MTHASDALHCSDAYLAAAQQLSGARQHVLCGLAGPCGRAFFELLLGCSRKGVALTVVVSDDAQDQAPGIAWERLGALGASLRRLRQGAPRLHTSVCVVDGARVLSGDLAGLQTLPGSQTWGLLLQTDTALADVCTRGLSQLVLDYTSPHDAPSAPLSEELTLPTAAIALYEDPNNWAPAWQTDLLKAQALALQAEVAEMHRTLNAFDRAQDAAIGTLLRECLDAKRIHLQHLHACNGNDETRAQAEVAQAQFERYTQEQDSKPAATPALDDASQTHMKQLYRKLAMRLHPDRVEDSEKSDAQALFQRLQSSYSNNDLAALLALERQVLLAASTPPIDASRQTTASSAYQAHVPSAGGCSPAQLAALRARLTEQHLERQRILRSATWQTLTTQSNWTLWFEQQAHYLQAELERYAQARAAHETSPATPSTATSP